MTLRMFLAVAMSREGERTPPKKHHVLFTLHWQMLHGHTSIRRDAALGVLKISGSCRLFCTGELAPDFL